MRKILVALSCLLVGSLSVSSCGSSTKKVEDACSIVRGIYSSLPDYPNAFDPAFKELKKKYDEFYAVVAPNYANKMREAAAIFRELSANNSEMAEYAEAANRFAKALDSGNFARSDTLGLVDFCG